MLYIATWLSGLILFAQDGTQSYVVRLRDDAVVDHLRRLPSFLSRRIDLQNDEAIRYRSQVLMQQGIVRRRMEAVSRAAVRAQMDTVFNGFAVRMRPEDVAAIASLPEVAEVLPSIRYHKVLDAAAPLVQLPAAWGNSRIGGEANAGAGVKIGVIDTGIDINHPMFQDPALTPPAGYPMFTAPTPLCPNSDQLFTNSKIIVARNYVTLLEFADLNCDAMDRDGHGTFVAGIAAGRRAQAPLASISGVAPKAFLGSYKVFGTPGVNDNATLDAILKALDDATKDGMGVINISLGADIPLDPSIDPLAQAATAAVNAGITVVVAAGNSGPASGTITSPGTSPAVITVGSTSNSRLLATPLLVSSTVPVPPDLQAIAAAGSNGPAINVDVGPAPLADALSVDPTASACGALPAASLTQKIVLIRRGGCSFATKILNATAAGARAAVIYNNHLQKSGVPMDVGTSTQIPSVMIGNSEGTNLANFLSATGFSVSATLAAQQRAFATVPNAISAFSGTGPSTDFSLKPDLLAPGENIYSAEQRNFSAGEQFSSNGFGVASGTSFSSPMVAGAAALVKQASPGLSPAQIKSALVHSASKSVAPFAGGVTGVLASGNGLLDTAAALTMPATVSPVSISFGNNAPGSILNQPVSLSIQNVSGVTDGFTLFQQASFGSAPVTLTPTPASFTLAPAAAAAVSVLATSSQPITGTVEGYLILRSQNTGRDLTIPYWGNFLQPRISTNGVWNAASLTAGPTRVAPGSLVAVFGAQMTSGVTTAASGVPLPTSLGGTRVVIGDTEAPLLYVSPTEIDAQVPQELAGRTLTTLRILFNGVASASALVSLAPASPGIFTVNRTGLGRGAVRHASDHREVTSRDPARLGETLEVFVNGLGPTSPFVATAQPALSNPLSNVLTSPTATLGGVAATVRSAFLVPSLVGVYQVNLDVPANVPAGEQTLILISNGVSSNAVTVSIGP